MLAVKLVSSHEFRRVSASVDERGRVGLAVAKILTGRFECNTQGQ